MSFKESRIASNMIDDTQLLKEVEEKQEQEHHDDRHHHHHELKQDEEEKEEEKEEEEEQEQIDEFLEIFEDIVLDIDVEQQQQHYHHHRRLRRPSLDLTRDNTKQRQKRRHSCFMLGSEHQFNSAYASFQQQQQQQQQQQFNNYNETQERSELIDQLLDVHNVLELQQQQQQQKQQQQRRMGKNKKQHHQQQQQTSHCYHNKEYHYQHQHQHEYEYEYNIGDHDFVKNALDHDDYHHYYEDHDDYMMTPSMQYECSILSYLEDEDEDSVELICKQRPQLIMTNQPQQQPQQQQYPTNSSKWETLDEQDEGQEEYEEYTVPLSMGTSSTPAPTSDTSTSFHQRASNRQHRRAASTTSRHTYQIIKQYLDNTNQDASDMTTTPVDLVHKLHNRGSIYEILDDDNDNHDHNNNNNNNVTDLPYNPMTYTLPTTSKSLASSSSSSAVASRPSSSTTPLKNLDAVVDFNTSSPPLALPPQQHSMGVARGA